MSNQSILNRELTNYFNDIINTIKNPELLGLKPGEKPFHNIQSLHYTEATETLIIEMDKKVYLLALAPNRNCLLLDEYDKPARSIAQWIWTLH